MELNRFLPDDKVTYVGTNSSLNGCSGHICAPVRNVRHIYVIDLDGGDSIIANEDSLVPYRADLKRADDGKKKETKVERRRAARGNDSSEE